MSCKKILCTQNLVNDISKQTIFFGEYSGFQRYDFYKYVFAKNLEEKMRQAFWNPNEISLLTDRVKFHDLPEHIQQIFQRNILFQTLMDSGQNRGLDSVLSQITTSPEFEAMFKTQGYFELIHSLSYSHILREVFPSATEIFDKIKDYPEIHSRIDKEIEIYERVSILTRDPDQIFKDLEALANIYLNGNTIATTVIHGITSLRGIFDKYVLNVDRKEIQKKAILELLLRIYALEGLKFYVSFLVTYVINDSYKSAIQGIAKIIKLINFDEDMHVAVTIGTLNILKKNKDEGFSELMASPWFKEKSIEIFTEVVEDEIKWGTYLLSFGHIPTLTTEVIDNFVKHYANERIKKLNGEIIYPDAKKSDVVVWFDNYRDINKGNTAQQETEEISYNIGILKNDLPEGKIDLY